MLTSNASVTNMSGVFGSGAELDVTDGDPTKYTDIT